MKSLVLIITGLVVLQLSGCGQQSMKQAAADASGKRMPLNEETLNQFADKLMMKVKKIEAGAADDWTKSTIAKKTVEEMGYNYEKTFVYFVMKVAPTGSRTATQLTDFFGQPVADPDGAVQKGFISDKVRQYLKTLNAAPGGTGEDVAALLYLHNKFGTNVFTLKQVTEGFSELQAKKQLKGELAELDYKAGSTVVWQRIEYNLTANQYISMQTKFKRGDDGSEVVELLDASGFKKGVAAQQNLTKLAAEMEAFIN